MKKILFPAVTFLLTFLFIISASATQVVNGNPIDWSNPEALPEITPSENTNEMENDTVLISFIGSTTNSIYKIIVRGNPRALVLESASDTNSYIEGSSHLAAGTTYTFKTEDNSLVIVKPDGGYAAKFDLINGFENTDLMVYGDCRVYGNHHIVLSDKSGSETSRPDLSKPPSSTEDSSDAQGTATNTNKSTALKITLAVTVSIIILVVIILMHNFFSKDKSEKSKPTNDSLYSSDNGDEIGYINLDEDDNGPKIPNFSRSSASSRGEASAAPSSSYYTVPPAPSYTVPPVSAEKKPTVNTMFTLEKIRSNWASYSDPHLLDLSESHFEQSPSFISTGKSVAPTAQQTPAVAESESYYGYNNTVQEEPGYPAETVDETPQDEPSSIASIVSNIYSIDNSIEQLRNAFGDYDVVQFAEVTSNCVIDFSYGIFDKYHLSPDSSTYSNYIILAERLLMLNPSRFGKINNSLIDGYFLNKMHPEIPFDFFYGNNPVAANTVANSTIESVQPAKVEKRDNVYVLVEKGKIFIRR